MKPIQDKCVRRLSRHDQNQGIALITALAFLAIFAIIMVSFIYSIRIEEVTTQNYSESINIEQASEAAIQAVLSQVARDLDPSKRNILLGREQPRYISLLDPWAVGYAGKAGPRVLYDARSHQVDVRPERVFRRFGAQVVPTPIPLGVDEDPPGDVTGYQRILSSNQSGRSQGDGFPGLGGVDDDLDTLVDNDGDRTLAEDDDEDFRLNEDPLDLRRPDIGGTGIFFPPGTGYDSDGDRLGVFDESAKINLNFAGNNNSNSNQFTYNQGLGPAELDLPVYIYGRVFRYLNTGGNISTFNSGEAEQLASQIVNFRNGSVLDGGASLAKPGADNDDDNGNNSPTIFQVDEYSRVFGTANFEGEPFTIIGDSLDNDDDGFLNEEDERYIGPTTTNQSGTVITDGIIKTENSEFFRMGDKIDNDGDGNIDEQNEGVDEPEEFNVFKPKGNDRPFASVEDLKLLSNIPDSDPPFVPGAPPSLFEILRQSSTIYSQSDQIAGPLSGRNNEVAKLNPNLLSNWRAVDVWETGDPISNRADFQYNAPITVEDLIPALQVDNDGDWQMYAEPDVINGVADGIDNDGDGLVDEPSDDWDGNQYASGDFDGFSEADVASMALQNGVDDDGDGQTIDENRPGQDIVRRKRVLGTEASGDEPERLRDEQDIEIRRGMVAEGDGADNDGDNLIDDDGDFNGDLETSYDPEWHVNEDDAGDMSGDGYPGLGGDPELEDENTAEGDLVTPPDITNDMLITSFIDDDFDGFADFNDPQVLAAMYAPEMDSVDNDGDGEVDEPGERYIAAFDDDEDGKMNEDPAEFQLALNLLDYIDSWAPYTPAQDEDIRDMLGVGDNDPVIGDGVSTRTFELFTTRQRAYRLHPRSLAGPNANTRDFQLFTEQMKLLLPNPPQTGFSVRYEGVEAIRINEVMPKPVIRLEAEEVLTAIDYNTTDLQATIETDDDRFILRSGGGDNGFRVDLDTYDTNWGPAFAPQSDSLVSTLVAPFDYRPDGFRHTLNTVHPFTNIDALSPAFIFNVTNVVQPPQTSTSNIGREDEVAEWVFTNLPNGIYDPIIYIHPGHEYRPEVQYFLNDELFEFRSDVAYGAVGDFNTAVVNPVQREQIRRSIARFPDNQGPFPLPYRLSPFPNADQTDFTATQTNNMNNRVVISNNELRVRIVARAPTEETFPGVESYITSFDRIELFNPRVQYVELVNISTDDVDLSGWQVNTPYGHYLIPENTVIGKMRPLYKDDDGREIQENQGIPGTGVPFENLLTPEKLQNNTITTEDRLLEDNKLLLAFDKNQLISFIEQNYPAIENIQDRVVEPVMGSAEAAQIMDSIGKSEADFGPAEVYESMLQAGDVKFRLVDFQSDVLTHNPRDKHVTLYDPAGNYIDSFRYRTTFNNAFVIHNEFGNVLDLVALPGYRGFESYERTDPTYFETELSVDDNGVLSGKRSVPSSIKLDVQDARLVSVAFNDEGLPIVGGVGSYQDSQNDVNNRGITRFKDNLQNPEHVRYYNVPVNDSQWNGWDFIGDWYRYPTDREGLDLSRRQSTSIVFENQNAMAREAVAPVDPFERKRFFSLLGSFENMTNWTPASLSNNASIQERNEAERAARSEAPVTAFVWRMGLRELVRAGYDPEVSDILTMRVLGENFDLGGGFVVDLPVGEVLTEPIVNIINPGAQTGNYQTVENTRHNIEVDDEKVPVFTRLRNGDTAGSIDLRQDFQELFRDLQNTNGDEPMVEIVIMMRKSSRDHSPSTINADGDPRIITFADRPDLASPIIEDVTDNEFDLDPDGRIRVGQFPPALLMDDNYFFKGIELFGRGRATADDSADLNIRRTYLAGTPGKDNTGYTPAYPRRRLQLGNTQRDEFDIIDNTAYVKNAPLATVGEISRLYTGNKFETVNTPIIAQRLEDLTTDSNRVESNARLGIRAAGNDAEYRIRLAQREQLDQWENQYVNVFNTITTAKNVIVPGLVNINTAPRELLAALPSAPPLENGRIDTLINRYNFNTIVADFIIEGRLPGGHDGFFGVHEIDDDEAYSTIHGRVTGPDTSADYKLPSVGRSNRAYKDYDDIRQMVFDPLNLQPEDIKETQVDFSNVFSSAIVSDPDDGPYANIGTLLMQISHLKRRERFSTPLSRAQDRTGDGQIDAVGDLRERLNEQLNRELTPEDMEALMNRISNMMTVRSRAFGIVSRGRILNRDGAIVSQRKLETVFNR